MMVSAVEKNQAKEGNGMREFAVFNKGGQRKHC